MRSSWYQVLFFPFTILYGLVIGIRNWLFDVGIFASVAVDIPTICVGNLAVGGTGKTPHAEYLLAALSHTLKVALLSRGYKRETNGFFLADITSSFSTLGDEVYQIYQKYPHIPIAVDENRLRGIRKLRAVHPDLEVVILDDAMQHRKLLPGLSILLTDFSNLYTHDSLLPSGSLREWRAGNKRAAIIVVTKCPRDLKPIEMRLIETEIKPASNQLLFFSSLVYDEIQPLFPLEVNSKCTYEYIQQKKAGILLVAGIVSPHAIVEHLNKYTSSVKTKFFRDHHQFTQKDYSAILKSFESLTEEERFLFVTEKDAARIVRDPLFPSQLKSCTYTVPTKVEILFDQAEAFIHKINSYVAENSRNR